MLPLAKPTARQPRKWTEAEDQTLREEVKAQSNEGDVKDWCRIAAKLPGRTNKDCRKRWLNSVAGGLKKGQWAKSEDIQLERGVEQFGQRWTLVAEVVASRSADQCAKRWQQTLDPELDRSEWQESEDQVLIEAVKKLGRHWKDIQRDHFPGRSKNCIKNRYTVICRRYQNSGMPLPEGAGHSSPITPSKRLSAYTIPDDDDQIKYDEAFGPQTQVSTPETQHSWPLDEEPFSSWPSQKVLYNAPAVSQAVFSTFPQQPPAHVLVPAQWNGQNWTTTSMQTPSAMNTVPPSAYSQGYPTQAPTHYSYGAMQGVVGHGHAQGPPATTAHRSSFHAGAPTSSRQLPNSAAFHDPNVWRYGMHGESHYRY